MRILVVGAGATGGFYGGRLALAGRDVTFLLRERRASQIRERGLQIVTHTGEGVTLEPKIVSAEQLTQSHEPFDLIVISTKSYALEAAMDDFAPAVGPETMLLPILNGMRQLAVLGDRFGAQHVLGGSVRIFADLDDEGRVLQMNPLDQISYGEPSGERTARILAVDAAIQGVGLTAILQPDILATLWEKWCILSSLGAVCVLARGNVGQAARAPHGPAIASAVVHECMEVAKANGYAPDVRVMGEHLQRLADPASHLSSSMYRDMTRGAPVEADHILGDLIDRARGVAVPLLTAAYVQLKVYEAGRNS